MNGFFSGGLKRCPVCSNSTLQRFDCVKDISSSKPTDILICIKCYALINKSAYDVLDKITVAQAQTTDFYSGSRMEHDEIRLAILRAYGLLDYLSDRVDLTKRQTFLDFGAGRGFVAMAAAQRFKTAYACEPSTHLVTSILEDYPDDLAKPRVVPSIMDVPEGVDVLFMWHALEHLPAPTELWKAQSKRLNKGCIIFLQIPLFRLAYVVQSHYVFYTESSLSVWASGLGARVIEFAYDVENGFLTMIAKIV
jgi:hypothetical protein